MIFKRTISLFSLAILLGTVAVQVHAQTTQEIQFDAAHLFSATETYGTPVHEENDGKKHYLVALTGMIGTELLIAGWNRFVARSPWAKVTWHDVATFYDKKTSWDKDWYWTNFVLHPYQGALPYMAGRSANLNRIESLALTAISDATWEWFFETNDPSRNDLVYSFLGAFPVGEMLYRLSLEAEQVHWLLGWALNPERMWTEFWTKQRPRGTSGNIYALSLRFSLGTMLSKTYLVDTPVSVTEHFPVFGSPEVYIVYNDPYGHDSNNPYSQFELRAGFSLGAGSGKWRGDSELQKYLMYDIFIFSNGMLLARAPEWGENRDTTIGFVFDFDFKWHSLINISAISPGVAIKQRINYDKSRIEWQWHLDADVLGTSDYYFRHRAPSINDHYWLNWRDYSYNFGAETVFMWKYVTDAGYSVSTDFHGYAVYDFKSQTEGDAASYGTLDTGWECIGLLQVDVEFPVSDRVRLGVGNEIYAKRTFYKRTADFASEIYADVGIFQFAYTGSVYAKLQLK